MAKKKNYWYVIVLANDGPAFVTSIKEKFAYWNKSEKPLEMGKSLAEDLAIGLRINGSSAFAVVSNFELDVQPFRYELGRFQWVYNEEKEDD